MVEPVGTAWLVLHSAVFSFQADARREREIERSETKSNMSLFSRGKMDVFWIGTVAKYH